MALLLPLLACGTGGCGVETEDRFDAVLEMRDTKLTLHAALLSPPEVRRAPASAAYVTMAVGTARVERTRGGEVTVVLRDGRELPVRSGNEAPRLEEFARDPWLSFVWLLPFVAEPVEALPQGAADVLRGEAGTDDLREGAEELAWRMLLGRVPMRGALGKGARFWGWVELTDVGREKLSGALREGVGSGAR